MKRNTVLNAAMMLIGCTVVLGGCASDWERRERPARPQFFSSYDAMVTHQFAAVQAQNGAAADAMLRPQHFDDAELNALGRQKLDRMTAARELRLITVYMNFPEDDGMEDRRDAVVAYLAATGIGENQLRFISGPNPDAMSPAAGHLLRLERTEGQSTGAWSADPVPFIDSSK